MKDFLTGCLVVCLFLFREDLAFIHDFKTSFMREKEN